MMLGGGGGSGGDGDTIAGRLAMVGGLQAQLNPATGAVEVSATSGAGAYQQQQPPQRGKEERVPQWSQQETRDLIAARAEMERDPSAAAGGSRRTKTLWEAVAARMRERGYRRTPDQCKCKWKNLVNRYKGKETADPETGRQCPFFEELHAVFNERARNMQRLLLESEAGGVHVKKKLKRLSGEQSSDEFSEDDNGDDEDSDKDERHMKSKKKKNGSRVGQHHHQQQQRAKLSGNGIHDLLHEFLQQQQRVEMQWHDMMERRAQERQMFQQEWRQSMEKLERERLLLEQSWREREEQRRMREESRAEKRDALLTALLNKLIHDDL